MAAASAEINDQNKLQNKPEFNSVEKNTMNNIGNRRRRLPPELPAITVGDVIYKELRQGNKLGYPQKGGFLIATNKSTGEILWNIRLYEINIDNSKETDVQEIFFTKMKLIKNGNAILIENELDKKFEIDLETRTVLEKKK
ncbi:hypothetical protein V8J88_23190 [Massilia sp. W12]|uniref:hypothetical protein n=1 Tax=Massilia sp. W12 TaxID=3126507 RepID=UPI0030CABC44